MKHLLSALLYSSEERIIDILMDGIYTVVMACEFGSSEPATVLSLWALHCCGDGPDQATLCKRIQTSRLERDEVSLENISSAGISLLLFGN